MTEKELVLALRKERQRQGITLRDMAEQSGLESSTIWRIESGQNKPNLGTLITYATALGLKIILQPSVDN